MSQPHIFSPKHALWDAGFRPFFILALFFGMLLPVLWGFVFSGKLDIHLGYNQLVWHAHEMFYGYAGAVLFGFLLTASKNWVGIRGIHGQALMTLTFLWLCERIVFYFSFDWPYLVRHLLLSLFVIATGIYIAVTLIKHRATDSFKDNYFFLILMFVLVIAKNLLITDNYYAYGVAMTLGLFRLAFTVMFERTITQFMKNTEGVTLYRNPLLDYSIKFFVLLSAFQPLFSNEMSGYILLVTAGLLFVRWLIWKPFVGFKKFGNATMYVGYLGLVTHFVLESFRLLNIWQFGTTSLHTFTFLCMGIVIPSMIVRIAQGHTGRKPVFFTSDKIAISFVGIAAFFRLALTILAAENYMLWIILAGILWALAYIILAIRLIPFMLAPRIAK